MSKNIFSTDDEKQIQIVVAGVVLHALLANEGAGPTGWQKRCVDDAFGVAAVFISRVKDLLKS